MPVRKALIDTGTFVRERIRSSKAETPAELAGNRLISGASTIALGGSIAAIATYYLRPPEVLHSHVDALFILLWQSAVFGIGKLLERRR